MKHPRAKQIRVDDRIEPALVDDVVDVTIPVVVHPTLVD